MTQQQPPAGLVSMTARTQSMTAHTQGFAYQPSRSTRAARSLWRVDRIKDEDERRTAFRKHLEEFPPLWSLI